MAKIEGFVKNLVDEASDEEYFKSCVDKQPWQDIPLVPSSNTNNGQTIADERGREESNEAVAVDEPLSCEKTEIPDGSSLSEATEENGGQPDQLDDEADNEEDVEAEKYLEENVSLANDFVCVQTPDHSNQGHGVLCTELIEAQHRLTMAGQSRAGLTSAVQQSSYLPPSLPPSS